MAFWGIEVKPGKPFTHVFDDLKGRLHVSMASLGMGAAATKSVLQCNVGNKSPVYLCCLYPEKTESLQLNLEFEEVDEVVFSVIGPRSVHLSGYYLAGGRYHSLREESESFGEDIADTDTQRSDNSDEDVYEDSFIDDGNLEVFPPSPVSVRDESVDNKKLQNGKGNHRRRLRKTYEISESDDEGCSPKRLKEDTMLQSEAKVDNGTKNLIVEDQQMQKMVNDNEAEIPNFFSPPSTEVGHEYDEKQKKRRKGQKNVKKTLDVDNANINNDAKEDNDQQDEAKATSVGEVVSIRNEQIQKSPLDEHFDHDSGKNKSEERKVKKKKKKKSKARENGETVNPDMPMLSVEEKNTSSKVTESKNTDAKTSQVQTLRNGLVVEELESGKADGKVALSGKKISVHYVCKLKKNGEVVDSNVGSAPYKFRLGGGKVIEGWDAGLEGMRVGEKRRLTIPPSMGFGSQGDGENIPPNSWLVYEVELIKVR